MRYVLLLLFVSGLTFGQTITLSGPGVTLTGIETVDSSGGLTLTGVISIDGGAPEHITGAAVISAHGWHGYGIWTTSGILTIWVGHPTGGTWGTYAPDSQPGGEPEESIHLR